MNKFKNKNKNIQHKLNKKKQHGLKIKNYKGILERNDNSTN